MNIIELINISKKYKHPVISNINYCFEEGKTYLIVGENGSGKTTLIKLIIGLTYPTSGNIIKRAKKIGYLPDNLSFPDFINTKDFLFNIGSIYNVKDLNEKIEKEAKRWEIDLLKKINELSKGMKQKVLIIQALLADFDIYIFDEPLNGLDKDSKNIFIEEILKLKEKRKTILIVSHLLELLSDIVDQIIEIRCGSIYERIT